MKSDIQYTLLCGCNHYFGDDSKEWFVKEMQELESKVYNFYKEALIELKLVEGAGNKIKRAMKEWLFEEIFKK